MARARRWSLRAAAVAGLAVLVLLALQLALTHLLPIEALVQQLSSELGHPLRVESAHVSLWPRPHVVLQGITMEPDIAFTAQRAEVTLHVLTLLRGGVRGTESRVHGVRLGLLRRPDGSLGFGRGAGASDERSAPGPVLPERLAVPRVVVHDALVRYQDRSGAASRSDSVQVERAELRPRDDAFEFALSARLGDGPGRLELSGQVGSPAPTGRRPASLEIRSRGVDPARAVAYLPPRWGIRAAAGPMDGRIALAWDAQDSFSGELDLHFADASADYAGVELAGRVDFSATLRDDGRFSLSEGRAHAESARWAGLDARAADATLGYRGDVLRFDALDFDTWGGRLHASGTVTTGDPVGFDLELQGEALELGQIAARVSGEDAAASEPTRVEVSAHVQGTWTGGEDWLAPIRGSGHSSMRGGLIPSGEVLESVVLALPRRWPRSGEPRREGWMEQTPLELLTASFELEGGRVHTHDLELRTAPYAIRGRGWIGSAGDYALDADLAFSPVGLSKLLAAASVRGRHDGRGQLPAVPFRVTGDLVQGHYRVHLLEQPLTTLVLVPWAVGEVSETASGAVRAGRRAVGAAEHWMTRKPGDAETPPASSDASQPVQ